MRGATDQVGGNNRAVSAVEVCVYQPAVTGSEMGEQDACPVTQRSRV